MRRFYLFIFILLFGAALWGLASTISQSTPQPSKTTAISNTVLSPQSAQQ